MKHQWTPQQEQVIVDCFSGNTEGTVREKALRVIDIIHNNLGGPKRTVNSVLNHRQKMQRFRDNVYEDMIVDLKSLEVSVRNWQPKKASHINMVRKRLSDLESSLRVRARNLD